MKGTRSKQVVIGASGKPAAKGVKPAHASGDGARNGDATKPDFKVEFDIGTIKHLGLQMYSTLPPVIGELVSNAWDADAPSVTITIPTTQLNDESEITVVDGGVGMSDTEVRDAYLIVGRDRRKELGDQPTTRGRKVMGRKGIGKFSAFGIAGEIEVETIKGGETSRFVMNYAEMEKHAKARHLLMPSLPPTGTVTKGTKITLRKIGKFRSRKIDIQSLRRNLARRFSIIDAEERSGRDEFKVVVNNEAITAEERDLKKLLEKDTDGSLYIWEYKDQEIKPGTGWTVSGWTGALARTNRHVDGIQRGIVVMARGKLVQEPFVFDATVGQQFALSYIVGELHAEFVDEEEDTIGTTRNSLVWDSEANAAFKEWGQKEVNRIARDWAEKRRSDNEKVLAANPLYQKFVDEANRVGDRRVRRVADKLIRSVITGDALADDDTQQTMIQLCLDFIEFDAFHELADEIERAEFTDTGKLVKLFREWEVIEAKEMMRVTEGRIKTIEKLQHLIETDALEVPTLHNFLKEFPWVLDPRWNMVADEVYYSQLLRDEFPEDVKTLEKNRRIDFLCVRESNNIVIVEIKRPGATVSTKELDQIEEYVGFVRDHVKRTTDPAFKNKSVVGYLLCGDTVDTWRVREKREVLENSHIYVRRYGDLLRLVEDNHREILERYERLRKAKLDKSPTPVVVL